MPQPQRLGLHHRLHLDERRSLAHLFEHGVFTARLECAFQHQVFDEVRDDAVLALGGDDHQTFGAGLGGLLGHQFDSGVSTTGSSSLGTVLVAGRNQVPRPAAGTTAVRESTRQVPS